MLKDINSRYANAGLELGVTRYFGGNETMGNGLLSGWAMPEPEHLWNDGCEAVLQTTIDDPAGPGVVEVQGAPFINSKCPTQIVVLHLNGFRIGYWRLSETGSCVLTAQFEREHLFVRGDRMLMRLAWSFPNSVSPIEKALSDDSRELAFCFRSILVKRIEMM